MFVSFFFLVVSLKTHKISRKDLTISKFDKTLLKGQFSKLKKHKGDMAEVVKL